MMCSSPTPLLCRLALAGALLAVLVLPAQAQTAESHFHTAANQYIGGDNAAALASVNTGLRLAPQDERLNRLKAEIEKQQEQQERQNQQNQENQQGDQQQGQNEPGEDDGEQGQNQPHQQDPGEQGQDEQQQQQGDQPKPESGEEGEQQGRPQPDPSKLSPAEAERILQALGNEEETLLRRVAKPQTRARRVEKDW